MGAEDLQTVEESVPWRVILAEQAAKDDVMAGFTAERDMGTEGAGYADVGLKQAVEQGIIPGPRMIVVTRAIVATGSYGPKGYASEWRVPQGAEEADGVDSLTRVVRDQIGHGADWIKVYADYRWGTQGAAPTFSLDELKLVVETAKSANVPVAAHATTTEGMRRAVLAGVETIEHGDGGTVEVFRLMKERGVALCPTLAIAGANAEKKKRVFNLALQEGVTIASGSDVGVYAHGDNAREIETMVQFGMPLIDALMQRYEGTPFVITTVPPTGSDRVRRVYGDRVFNVYLPYDLPASIRRFLDRVQPLPQPPRARQIELNLRRHAHAHGPHSGQRLGREFGVDGGQIGSAPAVAEFCVEDVALAADVEIHARWIVLAS